MLIMPLSMLHDSLCWSCNNMCRKRPVLSCSCVVFWWTHFSVRARARTHTHTHMCAFFVMGFALSKDTAMHESIFTRFGLETKTHSAPNVPLGCTCCVWHAP